MASIHISTDTGTLQTYVRAFRALGRRLDIDVRTEGPKPPFVVPPRIRPRGIDILLDVGRACARPNVQDDPAHLFAVLRYATAVAENPTYLALSQPMASLDPHKKMVLSDEFGCGLALRMGRELFGAQLFFDFHDAVAWGWVRTKTARSRQPDYIGICPDGTLVVLEAKGTQSGETYCRDKQIPSGCEQLVTVDLKNFSGGISARAVVGTVLRHSAAITPSMIVVGVPKTLQGRGRGHTDCELEIPEEELIWRGHFARLGALTGDEDLLDRLAPERPAKRLDQPRLLARRSLGNAVFTGHELIIEDAGHKLIIFVGLEKQTRDRLMKGDFGTSRESSVAFLEGTQARVPGGESESAALATAGKQHGPDLPDSELPENGELDAVSSEGVAIIVNLEGKKGVRG